MSRDNTHNMHEMTGLKLRTLAIMYVLYRPLLKDKEPTMYSSLHLHCTTGIKLNAITAGLFGREDDIIFITYIYFFLCNGHCNNILRFFGSDGRWPRRRFDQHLL